MIPFPTMDHRIPIAFFAGCLLTLALTRGWQAKEPVAVAQRPAYTPPPAHFEQWRTMGRENPLQRPEERRRVR